MSQLAMIVDFLKTSYKFDAFQEPRGVMRIFQFVFATWAFFSTSDFKATLTMNCLEPAYKKSYDIEYPFEFAEKICRRKDNSSLLLSFDPSSDAQFFVITAVLATLYALFMIIVYLYLDDMYKTKPEFPMADFALTTILGIFWLSGFAAWSNGVSGMEKMLNEDYITGVCQSCSPVTVSSFRDLNISLMIGFLNFFLWASDLWFLYKETVWFQARNIQIGYPQPQV
ncbi:unnamed protein product [Diamesa serratosioi]